MATLDDLLKFIQQYNALLSKNETKAAMRLAAAYKAMYARISPLIASIAEQIASGELTAADVRKLKSLTVLEKQLMDELTGYSGYLRTEVGPLSLAAGAIGAEFAAAVLKYLTGGGDPRKLTGDGLQNIMAWLQPGSALYDRIGQLAPYHSQRVIDAILESVGKGLGPRQVAREIIQAAEGEFGAGLVDALRMSRTAQLWGYREAARANYVANSEIVTGWIWVAELDDVTCMSCVAQHGQRYDLDEVLDDHHNGRCTMIPEIMGQNPIEGMKSGEEWFKEQPESVQQSMMGKETYNAYQGGAFGIPDMSRQVENDVWGTMKMETPLWELLGAEPPLRTK